MAIPFISSDPEIISVLIVSYDSFVARGLIGYLEAVPHIQVVDQVHLTHQFLPIVLEQMPQIVLIHSKEVDLRLVEVCQQLGRLQLSTKCVFLLASDEHNQYISAVKAGARGVLCYNNMTSEELVRIVDSIHLGALFIDPAIAYLIVKRLDEAEVDRTPFINKGMLVALTQREADVLAHLAMGQSNRSIAEDLDIEIKTVKNHLTNVYSKLSVRSRSEAIAIYYHQKPRMI